MIKKQRENLNKIETENNFFNLIKGIYEKPSSNIRLNGERLMGFPLRLGPSQGYVILLLLFNIVLGN